MRKVVHEAPLLVPSWNCSQVEAVVVATDRQRADAQLPETAVGSIGKAAPTEAVDGREAAAVAAEANRVSLVSIP